jgi:hypothetical protein
MAVLEIPGLLPSAPNQRLHWAMKAKQAKNQRTHVRLAEIKAGRPIGRVSRVGGRYSVLLVRLGSRALDSDNLQGAFKSIRDQVAELLGVDDGDTDSVGWGYGQEKVARGQESIRIEVLRV